MTGIDELRRTLDVHARALHDDGVAGRADAARARARAARQQRLGAMAVAVVAVLAATVTLLVWPSTDAPDPADRVLNGHEAPETFESLGYTYEFAEGVEGHDGQAAVLDLDPADQPRLVSWAVDRSSRTRITGPQDQVIATYPSQFTDFQVVPADSDSTYRVTGEGAALAVYDLTDDAPEGYSVGAITFRDVVAGDRLIKAEIGERGQSELAFDLVVPTGVLSVSMFCTGVNQPVWVEVEVGEGGSSNGSQCDDDTFDPGGQSTVRFDNGIGAEAGDTVPVRVRLLDNDLNPIDPEDVRLGIGFYAEDPFPVTLAGWHVPFKYEYAGHTWRYRSGMSSDPGQRRVSIQGVIGHPTLVVSFVRHTGRGAIQSTFDGRVTDDLNTVGGGSGVVMVAPPGEHLIGIILSGGGSTPRAELALAAYERID